MSLKSMPQSTMGSSLVGLKWLAFISTVLLFPISSCQKEQYIEVVIVEEMVPYFERFQEAGAQHGHAIDFDSHPIEGQISSTLEATIRGQCQHDEKNPSRVVINTAYWNKATDLEKEFLIFHELGHCYLQRSHLDSKSNDGICSSIMHSSASVCKNNYSTDSRESYLNELFNSN